MTEQISFTLNGHTRTAEVPDGTSATIIQAFAVVHGYEPQVLIDGDVLQNPESLQDFTSRKIREYIQEVVRDYLVIQARAQANSVADAHVQQLLASVTVIPAD